MVGMREEWEFVLHTAGLYERMGCDTLALDLVRNWEFLLTPPPKVGPGRPPLSPLMPRDSFHANGPNQAASDYDFDPRKLLRRRSSLVVADLPTREHVRNELAKEKDDVVEEEDDEDDDDDGDKSGTKDQASADADEDGDEDEEDEEDESEEEEETKPAPKKPPPTQFHEPDANSLLDAFGF
jgi:hypothetical protein